MTTISLKDLEVICKELPLPPPLSLHSPETERKIRQGILTQLKDYEKSKDRLQCHHHRTCGM